MRSLRQAFSKDGRDRLRLLQEKNEKQLQGSLLESSPYHRPTPINASMEFLSPVRPRSPPSTAKQPQVAMTSKPSRKQSNRFQLPASKKPRIFRTRAIEQSKDFVPLPKEISVQPFDRLALLGEGGSSYVFLIEDHLTQKRMVLKEYKRSTTRKALKEYLIGKSLSHESIVEYYSQQDNKIFMEHVEPDKPTCSLLVLAFQLAKAIHYLHINNVCHTDIKPKNIIVTKGSRIKLIDFGQSMKMQLWKKGRTGTYGYMAPEMFEEGFWNGKEVDVWSFGVVCKDWRLHLLADFCLKEKKDRPTIEQVLMHPIFRDVAEAY